MFILILLTLIYFAVIFSLIYVILKSQSEREEYESIMRFLNLKIALLQGKLLGETSIHNIPSNLIVYDINFNDLLEAVELAMNQMHPDNDGDKEKFIKYYNLYESLKIISKDKV